MKDTTRDRQQDPEGGRQGPCLQEAGRLAAGRKPTVPAGLLATHPDRCLQLGHQLVVDAPCHLRLQLVEALVTVGESLVAGVGETKRGVKCGQSPGSARTWAPPALIIGSRLSPSRVEAGTQHVSSATSASHRGRLTPPRPPCSLSRVPAEFRGPLMQPHF